MTGVGWLRELSSGVGYILALDIPADVLPNPVYPPGHDWVSSTRSEPNTVTQTRK